MSAFSKEFFVSWLRSLGAEVGKWSNYTNDASKYHSMNEYLKYEGKRNVENISLNKYQSVKQYIFEHDMT